jgi:hypothetical protein
MNKIIGVSGVAGSGKDTFFSLLSRHIPCTRFSLADELKKEVQRWCMIHYGVDSVNCAREEKELIREFLVYHAKFKRNSSEGRHWLDKLNDNIINDKSKNFKIITDIRYDDYENDEVSWLKNELGGVLVHVSMYLGFTQVKAHEEGLSITQGKLKKFKTPANSEETRNDPKIKDKSDFQIEWPFIETGQIDELEPYVGEFVKWLSQQKN